MGTLLAQGYSTFPHEMLILMAISSAGDAGAQMLNRPQDIASEYIGYQYNSLIRRGYLTKHSKARYSLTQKGNAILSQFLDNNSSKANETIATLNQIGIDTSQVTNLLTRK
jgi:predicted transcriptional regulator